MNETTNTIWVAQADMGKKPEAPEGTKREVQQEGAPKGEAQKGDQGGGYTIFIFIGVMFLIFYLLIIRPQSKKAKQHQALLGQLRKGDLVITQSGIYGKIVGLAENTATVEIAQGVRIKMLKAQLAGLQKTEEDKQKMAKKPK